MMKYDPKQRIHINDFYAVPWHEYHIGTHLSYSASEKQTTLVLYTKDHQKIVKITDQEFDKITESNLANNWVLDQIKNWQKELKTLYKFVGE